MIWTLASHSAGLDGAEEVLVRVVRVRTGEVASLLSGKSLEAALGDVVPLEVDEGAVRLDELMAAEKEGKVSEWQGRGKGEKTNV
jgi:hypothetical protein